MNIFCICTLIATTVHAQTPDVSGQLEKAVKAYRAADFESAIGILAKLVDDTTLAKDDKKEVYRILGLSYTAKGLYKKAKDAISELIKLEPPLVELDPDREPPKMMKIYYGSSQRFYRFVSG